MTAPETVRPIKDLPIPTGTRLGGNLKEFRADMLGMLTRVFAEHGDRVRLRFLYENALFIAHPDDLYKVLISDQKNFAKRTRGYKAMHSLLGNGLVTSEGDFWLRQRRIAQPSFHKKRIRGFADTMAAVAAEKATTWAADPGDGGHVDIADEMMEVALDIVGLTLLSTRLADHSDEVGPALELVMRDVIRRVQEPLVFPLAVPTPHNRKVRQAIDTLHEVVHDIISERRNSSDNPPDLLTMLMEATDEDTGEQMSDAQLRDEVMTIFLAGHETTANALTWTFFLLAEHPDVEAQLHEELDRVLPDRRIPTVDDLSDLKYTRMIIDESLRLFPPVAMIARRTNETYRFDDIEVPPDTFILFAPYVTHRHPEFWDDPERFDPERFREKDPDRPRFAYYPFLGGPRQCIGNTFALMEAQLVLATLASRFRFHRLTEGPPGLDLTITLRPEGGMPMRLQAR